MDRLRSTTEYRSLSKPGFVLRTLVLLLLVAAASWLFMKIGFFVADIGLKEILPYGKELWPHDLTGLTFSPLILKLIIKAAASILVFLISIFVGFSGYIFAMAVPAGVLIALLGLVYDALRN
ncbi:MAG: hypothetical protein PVJ01_04485 [Pseudomonadota bacterium]|jgi:hypothetical protein